MDFAIKQKSATISEHPSSDDHTILTSLFL